MPFSVSEVVNAIRMVLVFTIWKPNKSEPPTPTSDPSNNNDHDCPSKRRISSSAKVTPPIEPLDAIDRKSGLLEGVGVGVGVAVAVKVAVGVLVSVGSGVLVKVAVGPVVAVLVGVAVSVNVGLGPVVGVLVTVAVLVGVAVRVEVGVAVKVDVCVGVKVNVGTGVFVGVDGGGGLIDISQALPSFSFGLAPVPLSLSMPRLTI